MPSLSPSNPCGSAFATVHRTVSRRAAMSPQSMSALPMGTGAEVRIGRLAVLARPRARRWPEPVSGPASASRPSVPAPQPVPGPPAGTDRSCRRRCQADTTKRSRSPRRTSSAFTSIHPPPSANQTGEAPDQTDLAWRRPFRGRPHLPSTRRTMAACASGPQPLISLRDLGSIHPDEPDAEDSSPYQDVDRVAIDDIDDRARSGPPRGATTEGRGRRRRRLALGWASAVASAARSGRE